MENPSTLRNSKLNFLLDAICLSEQGLEGIVVSIGRGEGGRLGASCRAMVQCSVGTSRTGFLLARVFLGMVLLETKNETLKKEF